MELQLIRNATLRLAYAGRTILTDPMLSPVGTIRSFAGLAPNPTVELPLPVSEIVAGLDAVVVSHLHPDHFDEAAAAALPKDLPVFCQPGDEGGLTQAGFTDIRPVAPTLTWEGITFTRVGGRHGSGPILERMGPVSGFVLAAPGEPTLYWAGDTIWCDEVAEALAAHRPGVMILHAGGATIPGFAPILMRGDEVLQVLAAAPQAVVVAVHLEALDHCTVTRAALREAAEQAGVPAARLIIPGDGEKVSLG
ncbi:MAG: MBL fold metallo-hydrolase [Deltaproteobacteria bacterium]|nr:MBL fold metallo-hydrolase [Deltaproteobacteria bacterium]